MPNTPKRQSYLSWDETLMQIVRLIARRSKDPNTQLGACIVDRDNIIVGLGYNGFPRGCSDDVLPWSREGNFLDKKYAYVVHAERNALYNANKPVRGCKLYCALFPCNECAKSIIQAGITEIIYESDKYHDDEQYVASRRLLELAGIPYRQYLPAYDLKLEQHNMAAPPAPAANTQTQPAKHAFDITKAKGFGQQPGKSEILFENIL